MEFILLRMDKIRNKSWFDTNNIIVGSYGSVYMIILSSNNNLLGYLC